MSELNIGVGMIFLGLFLILHGRVGRKRRSHWGAR